jgi:hypothetical protein
MRLIRIRLLQGKTALAHLLLLAGFVVTGCGDGKIARYPVTGTVLVDGKPAHGVQVILIPIDGDEEFQRERPAGFTGPDGKFQLTTFGTFDGAPAGKYKVMMRWFEGMGQAQGPRDDRQKPRRGRDKLNGKFADPDQSGLTAEIEKGGTELPPFELRTK